MASLPDPNELRCRELVELVTDYLEDALPMETQARFEAHLSTCSPCMFYVEQIRLTMQTVARITEQQLEPTAREDMLHVFREWKRAG